MKEMKEMKEMDEYEQMDTDLEIKKKTPTNFKKYFILIVIIVLVITGFVMFKKKKNIPLQKKEKTEVIINFNNNEIQLTEKFKKDLANAKNPRIILCIGETRVGKSTLLNNIILDKNDYWFDEKDPFIHKTPFVSGGGLDAVTKEFHYYGPISNKELLNRNKLNFTDNKSEFEDSDLFFIDSEGAFNLDGDTGHLFHSIFALQSISTYILYVVPSVPNSNNLETIKNELTVLNLLNKEIDVNSPELIIVANRIEKDDNFKELSNEKQEKKTFYDSESNINERLSKILDKNLNFHYIIQWNIGLKSTENDFNLYWKTIEKICEITSKKSKKKTNNSAENLVDNFESTIKILKDAGLMNSTNFKNSEEVFNAFIKYKLDKIVEEEKQDRNKIYEDLIKKTINELTDEQIIEMMTNMTTTNASNMTNAINTTNDENYKVFEKIQKDFELKCKKLIRENLIRKLPSIINKIDKLELKVNEIYLPISQNLISKGYKRLDEIRIKLVKEGNIKLAKDIENLQIVLEDLRKKYEDAQKKLNEKPKEVVREIVKEKETYVVVCSIF